MAESVVWIDADGAEYAVEADPPVEGRLMPPIRHVEQQVPGQPGARLRETVVDPRDLIFGFFLRGASAASLREQLRSWLRRFDPTRGGVLRWTVDGTTRELSCRYAAGLEGVEGVETGAVNGDWFAAGAVVFRAHDPYWYDTSDSVIDFTTGSAAGSFFPLLPLTLSGSEIFSTATVDNSGDVDAWPTWTITGPGSNPVLRNTSTDKLVDLTGVSLTAGQTLTIDTRPGHKTVIDGTGANRFPDLSAASALFPLRSGSNALRIEMAGADEHSAVSLRYRRRWWGV